MIEDFTPVSITLSFDGMYDYLDAILDNCLLHDSLSEMFDILDIELFYLCLVTLFCGFLYSFFMYYIKLYVAEVVGLD
jgi:hypothetical protein